MAATIFANRHVLEYARAEAVAGPAQRPSYLAAINSPVVLLAFSYFILTAFAGAGIQTFGVVAWTAGYGLSAEIAALALSAYLFGVAGGMIGGGVLADRTTQHHRVAMAGMTIACTAVVATLPFGGLPWLVVTAMAVAGLASGTTSPSRDMLIRQAASKSGMGKVFGFVYSGFDLGLSVGPLLFGILVDHHAPRAVFMAVAAAFAVAAPTVMRVRQRAAT